MLMAPTAPSTLLTCSVGGASFRGAVATALVRRQTRCGLLGYPGVALCLVSCEFLCGLALATDTILKSYKRVHRKRRRQNWAGGVTNPSVLLAC